MLTFLEGLSFILILCFIVLVALLAVAAMCSSHFFPPIDCSNEPPNPKDLAPGEVLNPPGPKYL